MALRATRVGGNHVEIWEDGTHLCTVGSRELAKRLLIRLGASTEELAALKEQYADSKKVPAQKHIANDLFGSHPELGRGE